MIFENSSPKGIFGPNMSDSPNWSLTANSRSLQAAALKILILISVSGRLYATETATKMSHILLWDCENFIILYQDMLQTCTQRHHFRLHSPCALLVLSNAQHKSLHIHCTQGLLGSRIGIGTYDSGGPLSYHVESVPHNLAGNLLLSERR